MEKPAAVHFLGSAGLGGERCTRSKTGREVGGGQFLGTKHLPAEVVWT